MKLYEDRVGTVAGDLEGTNRRGKRGNLKHRVEGTTALRPGPTGTEGRQREVEVSLVSMEPRRPREAGGRDDPVVDVSEA